MSFPRKRESIGAAAFLDLRLRGGDKQMHPASLNLLELLQDGQ